MKLLLRRIFKGPKYTIGHLFINGVYECDTLEPPYMGTKQTDSIEFIKSTKKVILLFLLEFIILIWIL